MDCKYIKQNDFHEKYLLDRLSNNEKSEYLSHLNSCEACKNMLDSEKEIIGSVRHIGKSEMKSEIARQVTEIKSREKNVSWDMILKVAAIFFFLVITPGLVYYYQSVEPPKISELYNLDEAMIQPEEIEIVEEEKAERKETVKNILADNTDEKRNSNISDVLGSAGGKGAGSPIQSIGMAKPVKKSKPHTIATNELSTIEEKKVENEQLVSSSPSSDSRSFKITRKQDDAELVHDESEFDNILDSQEVTSHGETESFLPDLKKFKKPNFFQKIDHEYFKGKNFRSDIESYPRPPNVYKVPQAHKSIKTEKGIYYDKLRMNQIYQLRYNMDENKVYINLIPLYDNSDFYFQQSFPDSFPIIKKTWHDIDNTLDCFINEKIRIEDPANFSIYLNESDILYLYISNKKLYKIDLASDTTKAVSVD